jgi:hypothetical protein
MMLDQYSHISHNARDTQAAWSWFSHGAVVVRCSVQVARGLAGDEADDRQKERKMPSAAVIATAGIRAGRSVVIGDDQPG